MKPNLMFLIVLCFLSCTSDKQTKISINNSTNSIIDSLKITYGTEKESKTYRTTHIDSKEKRHLILDMNLKGVDGTYFLEIFQGGNKLEKGFGYYSNAVFKNYNFNLKIEKDTLLITKNEMN
ncbi:hypothetical protein [Psychroflexus sp. ALD_RP9]|uniref:hypothetical protein n=1 Tax=Psychroflexus sp. ALD_RP9 TaxID=2777186 RepID=UPI001A8E1361|nr:hypothetical protein [Psychroflexus sp. ALD_RP9]QSS98053.1 hypothetical protein IMZ30_04890 [Psychroflexus sp. ALD_RP9]